MSCWSVLWLIFVNLKFFHDKLDFSDLKQMSV